MRKLTAILIFLLTTIFAFKLSAGEAKAACVPECNYSHQECGSCRADPDGCYKLCRDVYDCLSSACTWYTKYGSYHSVSCSLPDLCGSCECSGYKTCYEQCSDREYRVVCTKPDSCPTPTPQCVPYNGVCSSSGGASCCSGYYCDAFLGLCKKSGDCGPSSDCDYGGKVCSGTGMTCIHTKETDPQDASKVICQCTETITECEDCSNTSCWCCVPYRDCYLSGTWYQQYQCTLSERTKYVIKQGCSGVVTPTPSPTSTPAPSCSVSLSPSSASLSVGLEASLVAGVVPADGAVDRVGFSSGDSSVASVYPPSDSTPGYSTTVTGVGVGDVTLTAQVTMNGSVRCSDSSEVSVIPEGPWWQVRDGDVAANGEIVSLVPSACSLPVCDPVLGIAGAGGFPGIPGYVGTIGLGSGSVSSTGWAADGASNARRKYSYAFFARQIPSDVEFTEIESGSVDGGLFESGGILSRGAFWYRYDGSSGIDLNVSGDADLGPRKVVLLVANADLYLDGKINLTDGEGFFAAIVGRDGDGNGGNVIVGPAVGGAADGVPELEGLFVADSEFRTGEGNGQLHVRGSVAGLSGILLQRDLGDDGRTPAEYFEYAPDLVLNVPSALRVSGYSWREAAP